MNLSYNTTLSKDERKMYTERLLKLHGILADAPPENYNHSVYTKQNGFWKRMRTGCGTAACAIGHACLHASEFPGFQVSDVRAIAPDAVKIGMLQPITPIKTSQNLDYFGPGSYRAIFDLGAYNKPDEKVTKYDALHRIEQYITTVLGCKLNQVVVA